MKICGFSRSIGTSSRVVAEFLADLASKYAKSVVALQKKKAIAAFEKRSHRP